MRSEGAVRGEMEASARAAAERTPPPEPRVLGESTAPPDPSEYFFAGLLATGLAAITIAVFTSFTGLQGTLVGAALGAMTGSLVTQIAKRPLSRAEARTIRTLGTWRRRSTRDPIGTLRSLPGDLASLWRRAPRRTLAAFVAIGACGLALGLTVVSLAEVATGRPLSSLTTGQPTSGTTLGNLAAEAQHEAPSRPTALPSLTTLESATPSEAALATASARVPVAGTAVPGVSPAVSPQPPPVVSPGPGGGGGGGLATPSSQETSTSTSAPAASPAPQPATPAPEPTTPAPQPATPAQAPSPFPPPTVRAAAG